MEILALQLSKPDKQEISLQNILKLNLLYLQSFYTTSSYLQYFMLNQTLHIFSTNAKTNLQQTTNNQTCKWTKINLNIP